MVVGLARFFVGAEVRRCDEEKRRDKGKVRLRVDLFGDEEVGGWC
jgi:hypothetical protein